jgi:PRTRC genetic system protein E
MVIVSKADDQHLTVSVVPKRMKESESPALSTPLCCTGTAEELDRDLPSHLQQFVAGQVTLSNNLAQIQREREEAEKAAREELKKKQKTVGNGGVKAKTPETKQLEEEKAARLKHQRLRLGRQGSDPRSPDPIAGFGRECGSRHHVGGMVTLCPAAPARSFGNGHRPLRAPGICKSNFLPRLEAG